MVKITATASSVLCGSSVLFFYVFGSSFLLQRGNAMLSESQSDAMMKTGADDSQVPKLKNKLQKFKPENVPKIMNLMVKTFLRSPKCHQVRKEQKDREEKNFYVENEKCRVTKHGFKILREGEKMCKIQLQIVQLDSSLKKDLERVSTAEGKILWDGHMAAGGNMSTRALRIDLFDDLLDELKLKDQMDVTDMELIKMMIPDCKSLLTNLPSDSPKAFGGKGGNKSKKGIHTFVGHSGNKNDIVQNDDHEEAIDPTGETSPKGDHDHLSKIGRSMEEVGIKPDDDNGTPSANAERTLEMGISQSKRIKALKNEEFKTGEKSDKKSGKDIHSMSKSDSNVQMLMYLHPNVEKFHEEIVVKMVKICAGISVDPSDQMAIRQNKMLCGHGDFESLDRDIKSLKAEYENEPLNVTSINSINHIKKRIYGNIRLDLTVFKMAYDQLFEPEGKPTEIIEIETVVSSMEGTDLLQRKFKATFNKLMAELKKMENAGVEEKTTKLGQEAQLAGYELLFIGRSLLSYSWEIINDDELKLTLEAPKPADSMVNYWPM